MHFFVFSRDAPGTAALRDDDDLLEEHWSYMDGFADAMVARGPTLASDRETATGSLHVLDLPSLAAAAEFAEHEPNNRAGVYEEHRIWAFENLLGRTMWEFEGDTGEPRFLVVVHAGHGELRPVPPAQLGAELRERLIVYGALMEPDTGENVGVALALHAADGDTAVALVREAAAEIGALPSLEVHDWELGGRR